MMYFFIFGLFISFFLLVFFNPLFCLFFMEVFVLMVFSFKSDYNSGMCFFLFVFSFSFMLMIPPVFYIMYGNVGFEMLLKVMFFKMFLGFFFPFFCKSVPFFFLFFYVFMSELGVVAVVINTFSGQGGELASCVSINYNFLVFFGVVYLFLACMVEDKKSFIFCLYSFDSALSLCSISFSYEVFISSFFFSSLLFVLFYSIMGGFSSGGSPLFLLIKVAFMFFFLGLPPFPMFIIKVGVVLVVYEVYGLGVTFFLMTLLSMLFSILALKVVVGLSGLEECPHYKEMYKLAVILMVLFILILGWFCFMISKGF